LLALTLVIVIAWSGTVLADVEAYDIQEMYHNGTGQTAYDLTKILEGDVQVDDFYGGIVFPEHEVNHFCPGYTFVHFWGDSIPDSGSTWACFNVSGVEEYAKVVSAFWTDENGNNIGPAGPATETSTHMWEGDVLLEVHHNNVVWDGDYPPQSGDGPGTPWGPIQINEIYYTVSDSMYSLADLNEDLFTDPELVWIPLADVELYYGDTETYNLGPLPDNDVLIVRYAAEGDGQMSLEMYQIRISDVQIPTLSEWAMIIFAVVIMALMTYVVVRRRRSVQPTTA
jgi:hypothetical protein